MKNLILTFGLAMLAAASVSAQMSKTQLQKMYMDYLKEEGFAPSVDEDGDVVFKMEGKSYFISPHENDQEYFSLVYPLWKLEQSQIAKAHIAVNKINRVKKVAKAYIFDSGMACIATEAFLKQPQDFRNLFGRMRTVLRSAAIDFSKEMED